MLSNWRNSLPNQIIKVDKSRPKYPIQKNLKALLLILSLVLKLKKLFCKNEINIPKFTEQKLAVKYWKTNTLVNTKNSAVSIDAEKQPITP